MRKRPLWERVWDGNVAEHQRILKEERCVARWVRLVESLCWRSFDKVCWAFIVRTLAHEAHPSSSRYYESGYFESTYYRDLIYGYQ